MKTDHISNRPNMFPNSEYGANVRSRQHASFQDKQQNINNNIRGVHENDFFVPRIPKQEPLDYPISYEDASYKKDYSRLQHNSSIVSDHTSVIPWNKTPSRSEDEMVCDSSTSPISHRQGIFAVPNDPTDTRKSIGEKHDFPVRPMPHMIPSEFLANISRRGHHMDRPNSTATSLRSTVIDFPSRNSSSFSSPRHSARGKKRVLSISPIGSDLDLTEIIRTSPNSLVAYVIDNEVRSGFASRNSGRNSSSASIHSHGSYGHLSPSPYSTPVHMSRQKNPFSAPQAHPESPSSSFYLRKKWPHGGGHPSFLPPPPANVNQVSSSTGDLGSPQSSAKEEEEEVSLPLPNNNTENENINKETTNEAVPKSTKDDDSIDEEGAEPENIQCLWKDCGQYFDNQNQLVQHVNTRHIQKNKKDCTCYWQDCSREEKPFKAMYMLVVHVRRHTGEKPHKCHYENCNKAYSRLENLKTHVRSHTGERPYVCEITGCQKAFSNASDRAKHQNRTHSSVKQYGCKVPGCPKRYTDPSSLRKHMKTVHGALPQPTKKFKADRPIKREEHAQCKVEEDDSDDIKEEKKNLSQCMTVKKFASSSNHNGNQNGSSYPTSSSGSSEYRRRGAYMPGAHNNSQQIGGGGNVDYGGSIPRMWGVQQASPTSTTNDADLAQEQNDYIINAFQEEANLGNGVQVQAPGVQVRNFPRVMKPLERLLDSNINPLPPRRGSNASVGSADSSYQSGSETYTGSRRGSDISLHSYTSSGRRSANLSSPMPSRALTPNRITQTVIEGEVLEHYNNQNTPPKSFTLETRDNNLNDFVAPVTHSRVSSGYGSQNRYFPSKSPSGLSPVPPSGNREIRRASEGTVRRMGDFNTALPNRPSMPQLRRGSEPLHVPHIIENVPRRHSFHSYNPLPLPATMQKSFSDESPMMMEGNSATTTTSSVPRSFANVNADVMSAANVLQMMSNQPQYTTHAKQSQQQQQQLQSRNLVVMQQGSDFQQPFSSCQQSQIMHAVVDSTVSKMEYSETNDDDPLTSFVESYNMSEQTYPVSSSSAMINSNLILSQQNRPMNENDMLNSNQTFNQQSHQKMQVNHLMQQTQHFQQQQQQQRLQHQNRQSQNQRQQQLTNEQSNSRLSHLGNFNNNSFLHPQQLDVPYSQPVERGTYDLTLQWRDNHFRTKHVEADSTIDPSLEELMIQGLGELTTQTCEENMCRPQSNMVINTMDTLLSSFAEENKYFENQLPFGRYP